MDFYNSLFEKSDLALIIFLLPVSTCFFGAVSLFFIHPESKEKRSLGCLQAVVFLCMLLYFIVDYFIYSPPYEIFRFFDAWPGLVMAPFIYLYLKSLIQTRKNYVRSLLFLQLPALITLVAYIIILLLQQQYEGITTWSRFFEVWFYPDPLIRLMTVVVLAIQVIYFCHKIFQMISRYQIGLQGKYSYIENIDLNWVHLLTISLIVFGFLAIVGIVTSGLIFKLLFSFFTFIIMFSIYLWGSKQKVIPEMGKEEIGEIESLNIYVPAKLVEIQHKTRTTASVILMEKINKLFEEKKVFLNPELSIQDLADFLYTNRTYVSRTLNNEQGLSFYHYVNNYRIKYAIELMKNEEESGSLNDIAHKSGFKTRSTFYSFFKNITGYTPKEYMQLMQQGKLQ